jgi:hypothetical protein
MKMGMGGNTTFSTYCPLASVRAPAAFGASGSSPVTNFTTTPATFVPFSSITVPVTTTAGGVKVFGRFTGAGPGAEPFCGEMAASINQHKKSVIKKPDLPDHQTMEFKPNAE